MARALIAPPTTTSLSLPPLSKALISLAQVVLAWETRRAGRHALRNLDARMLQDVGLDAHIADLEAHKPFWQA